MNIIICRNYDEVAKKASDIVTNELQKNDELHIGLATGSSQIGFYKYLVDAYNNKLVSFKNTTTYNLDEYVGLDKEHSQSYFSFMTKHFFHLVDIDMNNVHLPKGSISNTEEITKRYNESLYKNPLDIQMLGIGTNGHIGFNEPGTQLCTETFVVELDNQTREDNSRFFNSIDEVPKYAITMGIKNIMKAKKIVLLATGSNKADIIKRTIEGKITTSVPASILQLHPDVTFILDEESADKLESVY